MIGLCDVAHRDTVLLDEKGNERAGFATSSAGEVFLGLDSEKEQEA